MNTRSLTSPSNLLRRQKCPGSARMEMDLPEETTLDAEEGRLLHAAFATEELDLLHGEPKEAAQRAIGLRDEALETVFGSALPDHCEIAMEKPLAFVGELEKARKGHYVKDQRELFRGTADFVAIGEDRALVVDYKFG